MPIVKRNTSNVEPVTNNVTGSGRVVGRTNIPVDLYDSNKYGMLGSPDAARSAGRSTRAIDIESYTKYIPDNQLDINLSSEVLDEQRAKNQSGWELAGNATMQLGATILGGAITGAGAILALPELAVEGITSLIDEDHDIDWNNIFKEGLSGALYQSGIAIEEGARESFAIHLTKQAQDENDPFARFGDPTYWASMFPIIGSVAVSIIPVTGVLKGVSLVGKAMQGIQAASKLGKFAGRVGKVLSGRRFAQVGGTIIGAHLDSIEEIARGYDEQFEYAKSLGFSDEEATRYASYYASYSYRNGIISNAVTNGIEWGILTKGMNKILPDATDLERGLAKNVREIAHQGASFTGETAEAALKAARKEMGLFKRSMVKTGKAASMMLSEGLEETNMDFALSEGEYKAKKNIGIQFGPEYSSLVNRFTNFLSKNATWDSFLWGAVGGSTMHAGRGLVAKTLRSKFQQEREAAAYDAALNSARNIVETLSTYNGDLSPVIDSEGNVQDPAKNVLIPLFSELARTNSFEQGEILLNELANMTESDINEIYGQGTDMQSKKQLIEFLRAEYEVAKKLYTKQKGINYSKKWNNIIQNNMFVNDYLRDYYVRRRGIVEAELARLQRDYNMDPSSVQTKLKELDGRLHEYNRKLEVLYKEAAIQEQIISDYEEVTNNEELATKLAEYDSRSSEIQTNIVDLEDELNSIKANREYLLIQANDIRRALRTEISDETRANLKEQLKKIKDDWEIYKAEHEQTIHNIESKKEKFIQIKEAKSILGSDLKIRKQAAKRAQKILDNINEQYNILHDEREAYSAEHADLTATYNRAKQLNSQSETTKPREIINLEKVLQTLDFAIAKYNNITNDRDAVVREQETALDDLERLQKEREDQEAENERNSEEINDENIVGDETITDSEKIIDEIESTVVVDAEGNIVEDGAARIRQDETQQSNRNVNQAITGAQVRDLTDTRFGVNASLFTNGFAEGVELLNDIVNSNKFTNAFLTPTTELNLLADRADSIKEIRAIIDKYYEEGIDESTSKKLDNIKSKLADAEKIVKSNVDRATLTEFIRRTLNLSAPEYGTEINNDLLNNFVQPFIETLANYMSNYAVIINGQLRFKRISGYEQFMYNLNTVIADFKQQLATKFYSKYNLETFDDFKIYLENELTNFKQEVAKGYQEYVKSMFKMMYDNNRTFLTNIENIIKNKGKNKVEYSVIEKLGLSKIVKSISEINEFLNEYQESGKIPSDAVLDSYLDLLPTLSDLHNNLNTLTVDFTQEEKNAARQLGISSLAYSAESTLEYFNRYRQDNTSEGVQEAGILYSLEELVSAFSTEDMITTENSDYRNVIYTPNDIEYYLSDAERVAYKALGNVINRFTELQIYNNNHKITFEDLLSVIYSQPNGKEFVENNYRLLYHVINTVLDNSRIEQIKSLIKANVPREATYKVFFNLLNDIQTRIANPKFTIDGKYIQQDGTLKESFLKYFEQHYTPSEWMSDTRDGVVLPSNDIFNALKKAVDPKTNTIASKIVIDGVEYSVEEIIEAQQSLEIGKELISKISNDGQVVNLYTTINGKALKVGEIRIDRGYTYHGMPLTRLESFDSDTYIFDSWIGTEAGLSHNIELIIKHVVRNSNVFDSVKNFVLEYERLKKLKDLTSQESQDKLKDLLNEICEAGKREDSGISPIYNAILNAIVYNTVSETETGIDLDKVYNVLNPIFYNIPREHVNDMLRNTEQLRFRYNSLRNRLIANFKYTDNIRKELSKNPYAQIVITHLDKPSYSFAQQGGVRNNIYDNIPTSVEVNGEPTVEIVTTQDIGESSKVDGDFGKVISSVTTNSRVTDQSLIDKLNRSQKGTQFYAVVVSHQGSNGKSLVPLRRNSVGQNINGDNVYTEAALFNIQDLLGQIIGDRFLGNLSTTYSEYRFQATQAFKDAKNQEYKDVIDDLSETIIVDNQRDNALQLPWFEVSQLYKNTTRNGDMYYAKDITFIANDLQGNRVAGQKSFGYKLRVIYDYNPNETQPSKVKRIELSRVRTKQNRVPETIAVDRNGAKVQVPAWIRGLTNTQIKNLVEAGFTIDPTRGSHVSIDMTGKSIRSLLETKAFTKLFGSMVRATNMVDHNGAKMFDSRAKGASIGQSFNNGGTSSQGYTSVALEKLKMAKKYNGPTHFNSIQDFYIQTEALTTGVVGTKTSDGKVISIVNYSDRMPNVYVDVKRNDPNVNIIDAAEIDRANAAQMLIKVYASDVISSQQNDFQRMINDGSLNKQALISLGLANEDSTDEFVNGMINFFKDTFKDGKKANLMFVSSYEDMLVKIPNHDNITETQFRAIRGEFLMSENAIVIYNNIFTNYSNPTEILGRTLLHESLHYRVINALKNKDINKSAITQLNSIINYLFNDNNYTYLSDNEKKVLKSYIDRIKNAESNAYSELVSYVFTEPQLAAILNKIDAGKEISVKRESIWNKLLDILLELIGFSNVKQGSVLEQIRNTIVNNIRLKAGVVRITTAATPTPAPHRGMNNESSNTDSNIESNVEANVETFTEQVSDDNPFENLDDLTFPEGVDITLFADDVNGESWLNPRWGKGENEIGSSSLYSLTNFVSLTSTESSIDQFKSRYIDEDGLPIC